jgi:hypothetical protein
VTWCELELGRVGVGTSIPGVYDGSPQKGFASSGQVRRALADGLSECGCRAMMGEAIRERLACERQIHPRRVARFFLSLPPV